MMFIQTPSTTQAVRAYSWAGMRWQDGSSASWMNSIQSEAEWDNLKKIYSKEG